MCNKYFSLNKCVFLFPYKQVTVKWQRNHVYTKQSNVVFNTSFLHIYPKWRTRVKYLELWNELYWAISRVHICRQCAGNHAADATCDQYNENIYCHHRRHRNTIVGPMMHQEPAMSTGEPAMKKAWVFKLLQASQVVWMIWCQVYRLFTRKSGIDETPCTSPTLMPPVFQRFFRDTGDRKSLKIWEKCKKDY